LTFLVDQLATQLLALGAGEGTYRLAGLTTTSLPALRAYLNGRAAYRGGSFAAAARYFDQAMELDSSFALAGLGRRMVAGWIGEPEDGPGARLAWRHRDRLSGRDLLLLRSQLGPRFPFISNIKEGLGRTEALLASAPDDPEVWASLADGMYHYGPLLGIPDARQRSLQAYGRALALDSTYAPSLDHRHELYYEIGDTAAARAALMLSLQLTSSTPGAALKRWFGRRALGDTVLGKIFLTNDSLHSSAGLLASMAVRYGIGLADAESVLAFRRTRVSNTAERERMQELSWTFYLIQGQPQRAAAAMPSVATPTRRIAAILAAVYGDADSEQGSRLAAQIPRSFTPPARATDGDSIQLQYTAAQYDLARGRIRSSRDAVSAWRGAWTARDTSWGLYIAAHLAVLLDAQLAAVTHRPDLPARISELDSILQVGPEIGWFSEVGNIVVARLWNGRGDPVRALEAVRRRLAGLGVTALYPTSLRDEGRYAVLAGDRTGAIRAYRHYLALRSNPEPAIRARVEEARAELAALERESMDR
jgi:tetratricopeptide (TPR) repeat protein